MHSCLHAHQMCVGSHEARRSCQNLWEKSSDVRAGNRTDPLLSAHPYQTPSEAIIYVQYWVVVFHAVTDFF